MKQRYSTALVTLLALYPLAGLAQADILTLKTTLAHAKAHDPEWAALQHGHEAARESGAFGRAGLLPKVNARAATNDVASDAVGVGSSDYNTHSWGVGLTQPLFSLAAWHDYQAGKAAVERADAQFSADEQAFLLRVVGTYFDVLRAQVQLDTRNAEEAAIARQLEQTRQRFKVGLVPKTDVLEAEAGYDLTVVGRISAETQLEVARRTLASLTHVTIDGVRNLKSSAPIVLPEPADQAAWVKQALDNNPTLKAALSAEDAARASYNSARAGHLPSVNMTANRGYSSSGSQIGLFRMPDTYQTTLGLEVSVPLYSGGAVSASRRQKMNLYYQAKDQAQFAMQATDLSASNLYLLVNNHVQRVNAYAQSIRSAESALTATQAGYDAGTRTVVDVLGAQKTLYGARSDYANARYDYVIDSLKLKLSAGILGENDVMTLNDWLEE